MTRWSKEHLAEYMERRQHWNTEPLEHARPSFYKDPTPDKGRESKLQAKIIKWALDKGYPVFHDRSRKKNVPGWPDLTICLPEGIVLFLELKSAKGVMRPEQKHIRQQMVFLGHHHFVVKSYKGFLSIIMDHDYANNL